MRAIFPIRLGGALTALALLIAAGLPVPAGAAVDLPGPLVDVGWLGDNLGDDNLVVIDMRPEEAMQGGTPPHIPGARVLAFDELRMEREEGGMMLTRMSLTGPAFERLMRRVGIDADDSVVVTWSGDGAEPVSNAAYLYWQLKYYGHERVALLNGGNAAWEAAGNALTARMAPLEPGNFLAGPGLDNLLATTEEVRAELEHSELVDTRPLAFHIGLEKRDYVYDRGHIPGSDIFPFTFYTHGNEQRFRSGEELRAIAGRLGLELGRPMIVYCNSGHSSASGWFVLNELMGERAALYDGSLHAWTQMDGAMTTSMHR
jgi:thiosulfate/3-mercaptopyruvate sulfurtransferase